MASAGMDPDIHQQFTDEEEITEYYSRQLSRDQIEELAANSSVSIPETNKEEDLRRLLHEEVLEDFHEYNAELFGIGKDTIVEGIQSLDEERLRNLSDSQLDDKQSLLVQLHKWEWGEKIEIIKALRSFKSKRNYKRQVIKGERKHSEITEEVLSEIEDNIRNVLPDINETRRKKIDLKTVEKIDEADIILRFLTEAKSSRYEQFLFRNQEEGKFTGDRSAEVENIRYWPLTSKYIYVDYGNKEYDVSLSKHEDQLLSSVFDSLFENPDWGEDVQFADPTEFSDQTPQEFVQERVKEQKETIDDSGDLLDDEKKEAYNEILDGLGTIEQTAIVLENINVEGDPIRIELETDESLSEFLEHHNWNDQVEEFNEKSQQQEYTLRLGEREIQVGGTQLTIFGDVTKEEEHVITSLLRKEGATI